jgi:tetratricopeptide (TPR) repeat protein
MKLLKNISRNIHLLRSNRPATPGTDRGLPSESHTILSKNSHADAGGLNAPRDGAPPADRDGGAAVRGTPRLPADFSPQGYRDRNPELRDLSDDETRLHYAATGRASGLAYRPDQVAGFDPDHFRETHPAFAHAEDAACLAAWQAQGGPEGDPGHQAAHLARLGLSLRAYPAAFPWRFYTRLYPRAAAHRWAALAHFLREGFAEAGEQLPYGEDAASFLTAVGDHFAGRQPPAAIRAYELAAAREPSPTTRARLAEAYGRAGAWSAALALYEEMLDGLADGDAVAGEAALRGFLTAAAARAAWPRLLARLPRALAGPVPEALGDALVRETAERYFAERSRAARALYTEGFREEGDACLAAAIRGVADLSAAGLPAGTRAPAPEPFVAVLADGLPDAARRRLDRSLDLFGCAVRVFDLGAVRAFEEALPGAQAAVVVRMPAWPTVVQALVRARRLGVPTLYETDELTIDPRHAPPPLPAFEGRIGERAYEDLVFGVALYRGAAALCEYGLAPTRALAAHLDRIVGSGRSFVVRDAAVPGAWSHETGEGVRLFLHAARSRSVGPADPAGAALLHVLGREPRVRLTTAGFVVLDDAFAPFSDRITQAGPVPDWEEVLRECDLNLVPADGSEADACLAPTGWLSAARFGIPTLAEDTPAHRETLRDGIDIHLASGREAWTTALGLLVAASGRRAAIGAGAARRLRTTHSPEAAAEEYRTVIETLRSPRP